VIHAVGPVWGSGDEDAKLTQAVDGSLSLAELLEVRSLALPAISTGIFGFPVERAARVITSAVQNHFTGLQPTSLELVRLIIFDELTLNAFSIVWEELFHAP
jgi:O-acetyl-ADP-ribose deacetylase (regulator of RNase III)